MRTFWQWLESLNPDGTDDYGRIIDQDKYNVFYKKQRNLASTPNTQQPHEILAQASNLLDQWVDQPQVYDMLRVMPNPTEHPGFTKFISKYSAVIQRKLAAMLINRIKFKMAS